MPTLEGGQFQAISSQLLDTLLSGTIVVFLVLIMGFIILGVVLYVRHILQFNIKVRIKSIRNPGSEGQVIYKIIEDKGAFIYKKKKNQRWFRLRREKVDLPVPPLETLELGVKGQNYVNILQKSDDEYYFLLPDKIDFDTIIKNQDGKLVKVPVGKVNLKIVEGDVSYWNQIRKRKNEELFDTESLLMKLLPFIVPVLMFMLVIFLTYIITDHWGEFASAAQYLKETAEILRDVSTATTTTSSGVGG